MSNLSIVSQIIDDKVLVKFVGKIDEDVNFEELQKLTAKTFYFDFEGVTLINSPGIREWMSFLDSISSSQLVYQNCQQIIMEQISMIHGFLREGAKIESFYAPYYCEECDVEQKILIKAEDLKEAKAPEIKHDCGSVMEFDAIEDQYFNFMKK